MPRLPISLTVILGAALIVGVPLAQSISPEEDYGAWPVLVNPFESTSGGGVMIDDYRPVVEGKLCKTDFTVRLPAPGALPLRNEVEFDAVAVAGGILCTNGRWRAKDGSASGTTPFRVFLKDGLVRRPPA
jgi:hypothetical protein